jgi:hypothetical protein
MPTRRGTLSFGILTNRRSGNDETAPSKPKARQKRSFQNAAHLVQPLATVSPRHMSTNHEQQVLWATALNEQVQMKRSASSTSLPDESPVSIDALLHPMVPHETEQGAEGWCARCPHAANACYTAFS